MLRHLSRLRLSRKSSSQHEFRQVSPLSSRYGSRRSVACRRITRARNRRGFNSSTTDRCRSCRPCAALSFVGQSPLPCAFVQRPLYAVFVHDKTVRRTVPSWVSVSVGVTVVGSGLTQLRTAVRTVQRTVCRTVRLSQGVARAGRKCHVIFQFQIQ